MERTYAANVRGADEIKVCGFVDTIRNKSKMAFIVLKDITGKVQVTVEKNEDPELDAAVNSLTPDSVITVIGKAVESEYVKLGGVEIYPKKIIVESIAAALPIDREARKGHEQQRDGGDALLPVNQQKGRDTLLGHRAVLYGDDGPREVERLALAAAPEDVVPQLQALRLSP